ncbi:AAA family ATPase [archaeon]|jgi:proteasome regulatory subunit|nr:AAA family ATPase [archaeon]MBT6697703.1 AAA family ATPase [archaeon]
MANSSKNDNTQAVRADVLDESLGATSESDETFVSEGDYAKLEQENDNLHMTLRKMEEESSLLKALFNKTHTELQHLKKPSLLVADVVSIFEGGHAVIKLSNGNRFYSTVSMNINDLEIGDTVLVEQKTLNVVGKVAQNGGVDVEKYVIVEKPSTQWKEIGGLDDVVQEIKEVIELPMLKPELFVKLGINPPKGILLHGPPGTGKTMLAKAVAAATNATFIEVTGSELVQKFIGEGSKLVKEIFSLARARAPTILFIDEVDALASARLPMGTSGEREVNRTFMQLLAELDGFKSLGDVKIIAATNRKDILDPAIMRPGRFDRMIEIGLPNDEARREILKIHTKRMGKSKISIAKLASDTEGFSGAELKAVCTEAGYFAIRRDSDKVNMHDFEHAIEKVASREESDDEEHVIFG